MTKHYDFCVLGAGLAGMHTAVELIERGASVCVIDPKGIAGGASGTPVGLANPATGRYASRSWNADISLNHLSKRLIEANDYSSTNFYKQTGVLRPALDEKIALRMQKNLESESWNKGSIEWMKESDLKDFHPGINCVIGGVWVPKGITVQIPDYLKAIKAKVNKNNCSFYLYDKYEITKSEDWKVKFISGEYISASKAIFTSGIWTNYSKFWNHLKMHAVKGQTLILESKASSFDHAVSALGYISMMKESTYILGSTYEHKFDHENPDNDGQEYMISRLKRVLPEFVSKSKIKGSWASIRASTPDRKPYVGSHSTIENCYVFAGLGSKGLLYSSIGAQILVDHIFDKNEIPDQLSIDRFK